MDDLAGKLQSILSDEESLRQIKELADMLRSPASNDNENSNQDTPSGFDGYSNNNESSGNDGSNSNNSDNTGESDGNIFSGINIAAIMSVMSTFSETDKNSALIMALRPHLSTERQEKADKAVKMLKLYNVYITLKENGMLEGLL